MEQSQKSINNFVRSADAAGSQLGRVNRVMGSFTNLASGGALAAGVLAGALVTVSAAGVAMALTAGKQAEELEQLSAITGDRDRQVARLRSRAEPREPHRSRPGPGDEKRLDQAGSGAAGTGQRSRSIQAARHRHPHRDLYR